MDLSVKKKISNIIATALTTVPQYCLLSCMTYHITHHMISINIDPEGIFYY